MNTLATYLKSNCEVEAPLLLTDLTDKTKFKETLDLRACKYVSSLTFKQFREEYCTGKWKDDQTEAFTPDVRDYQRRINAMCSRLVSKEGLHHPTYKYGGESTVGRLYVKEGGLQCLSKPLRFLLSTTDMIDYDIVNCHPAIMLWICDAIGTLKTPYLEEYVNNRGKVLEETKKSKMEMLSMLNKDYNNPKGECNWIQGFIHELKLNKTVVYDIIKDAYPVSTNKKNPISSTINKLWCEIENRCIQTAIQTSLTDEDKCSPQFDGFQTNRCISIDTLNELTSDLSLEWKVKEWTKTEVPADFDEKQGGCYESVKAQFEEDHFIIEEPLMFNINDKFVTENDFKVRSKKYKFIDDRGKKQGIYDVWIADANQRCYKGITSQPFNPLEEDPTPDNIYNEASPFGFAYIPKDERDPRAIEDLKYILMHLCTEEAEVEYLLRFIADIIQNPRRNPQVLVVFKGHAEGVGKDTINKTLVVLLSRDYAGSIADLTQVFGGYNPILDGKLVLQFNECQSKQGHTNWDLIKDQITADENCIKQKYLVDKWQPNHSRIFVSSNNPNPTGTGRRPFICQTRVDIRIPKQWFKEYYGTKMKDERYTNSMGSELLDLNLSDFNVMEPPETEVHQNKSKSSVRPIHRFLQKLAEGDYNSQPDVFQLQGDGVIGCKKKWLMSTYRSYHDLNFHTETPDLCKVHMTNWINEYVKSITWEGKGYADGKQVRCVKIDTALLITSLKNGNRYTSKEDEEDDL